MLHLRFAHMLLGSPLPLSPQMKLLSPRTWYCSCHSSSFPSNPPSAKKTEIEICFPSLLLPEKVLVGSNLTVSQKKQKTRCSENSLRLISSNISAATSWKLCQKLRWKTACCSRKESCEHGEVLQFGGAQNIPWWWMQKRLKAGAVPTPNPHRSFKYPTRKNYVKIGLKNKSPLSAESVIKSFYISVFHIKSLDQFIQWESYTCTKSWFGFRITRSSVKVLFLHIQQSKNGINQLWPIKAAGLILRSSRVRWLQEKSKIHCQSFFLVSFSEEKVSYVYSDSTWFQPRHTKLKSKYLSLFAKSCANWTEHKEMATINLDWWIGVRSETRRQGRLVCTSNPLRPGWHLEQWFAIWIQCQPTMLHFSMLHACSHVAGFWDLRMPCLDSFLEPRHI